MNYLKLFHQDSEYQTFITGGGVSLPNVSYCENENEVHYKQLPFYKIPNNVIKYITSDKGIITPNTYAIRNNNTQCSIISNTYTGDFGLLTFDKDVTELTSAGSYDGSFTGKKTLNAIILPESITRINSWTFIGTTNLTNIVLLSQQPPFSNGFSFYARDEGLTLFVPDTSVESYKAIFSKSVNYNVQPISALS